MVQFLTIFAVLLAATNAVTDSEWIVYKATHSKHYGQTENYFRRMIYEKNVEEIKQHNILYAKGKTSYFMKDNEFADMTDDEFKNIMMAPVPSKSPRMETTQHFDNDNIDVSQLPPEVNWAAKGRVTGVKNQRNCTGSWAFAATGAIEGAATVSGLLVSLSEQYLLDCGKGLRHSCRLGSADSGFQIAIDNGGIDTEFNYPYTARDGQRCHFNSSEPTQKVLSKVRVQPNEDALQAATANNGPIAVNLYISVKAFKHYGGGVYDDPHSSPYAMHDALVIGYGNLEGTPYWLIKNSWGSTWGLQGFGLMSRNKSNQCLIASNAVYPIVPSPYRG